MLKNYIKIAWRNILKHKSMFAINIAGLAIGIASCLLMLLFVVDELSYDTFNEKADDIVRVVFKAQINGEKIKEAVVMAPVAQTLKNDFPEVVDATRIYNLGTPKIAYGTTAFRNGKAAYVDPNFFNVFTLPIINGDTQSPLEEPNTVVLTESEANKYFGNSNPIGKNILIEGNSQPFRVTAIIENVPQNSHFRFDVLASMQGFDPAKSTSWVNSNYFTYLVLENGKAYKGLEKKLPQVLQKYMGPQMQDNLGVSYSDFMKDNQLGLFLQPLTDIHLNHDFVGASQELEQGGDIKYVYIFSAIALFMLLIACINFMNLSTASASKRSREVGIRKVLGSQRKQLWQQFLSEAFIATVLALFVALGLLVVLIPKFNELSGKALQLSSFINASSIGLLIALTFFISLLAGAYPSLFLSSFKPISALKSKFSNSGHNKGVRSGLVVFQFAISTGLILATLIVRQQMNYIQQKDVGYDKEQLLVLRDAHLLGNSLNAFKQELLKNPKVGLVTQSAFVPAGPTDINMSTIYKDGVFSRRMAVYNIDGYYLPTMGMELISGRNFSKAFGADSTKVIINETASRLLGLENDALGKTITDAGKTATIIGVVKDFHFKSLHTPIEPLLLFYNPYGGLILKARTADMAALIADTQNLWKSFGSGEPFEYELLDQSYQKTYLVERKMGTILNIFAILTVFVACLGLFGLITFTAEQRFKEIGIRKVLGSTVPQIVGMLSKDFLKLVVISFFIAFPIGFYAMGKWLEGFAYRIQLDFWAFLITAIIILLIAFATVGYKSFSAATMNPVKALKDE